MAQKQIMSLCPAPCQHLNCAECVGDSTRDIEMLWIEAADLQLTGVSCWITDTGIASRRWSSDYTRSLVVSERHAAKPLLSLEVFIAVSFCSWCMQTSPDLR